MEAIPGHELLFLVSLSSSWFSVPPASSVSKRRRRSSGENIYEAISTSSFGSEVVKPCLQFLLALACFSLIATCAGSCKNGLSRSSFLYPCLLLSGAVKRLLIMCCLASSCPKARSSPLQQSSRRVFLFCSFTRR